MLCFEGLSAALERQTFQARRHRCHCRRLTPNYPLQCPLLPQLIRRSAKILCRSLRRTLQRRPVNERKQQINLTFEHFKDVEKFFLRKSRSFQNATHEIIVQEPKNVGDRHAVPVTLELQPNELPNYKLSQEFEVCFLPHFIDAILATSDCTDLALCDSKIDDKESI